MEYDVYFFAKKNDIIVNDRSLIISEAQYQDILKILASSPETYEKMIYFSDDLK